MRKEIKRLIGFEALVTIIILIAFLICLTQKSDIDFILTIVGLTLLVVGLFSIFIVIINADILTTYLVAVLIAASSLAIVAAVTVYSHSIGAIVALIIGTICLITYAVLIIMVGILKPSAKEVFICSISSFIEFLLVAIPLLLVANF